MSRTLSGSMFSMSLSREGIQLGARWQFWKNTHFPLSMALCIKASAQGPWEGTAQSRRATWRSSESYDQTARQHSLKDIRDLVCHTLLKIHPVISTEVSKLGFS